jgi:hypothetical protein
MWDRGVYADEKHDKKAMTRLRQFVYSKTQVKSDVLEATKVYPNDIQVLDIYDELHYLRMNVVVD